jgi:nudix-type nucleoside diphosphatase (YffH/AdpP family)
MHLEHPISQVTKVCRRHCCSRLADRNLAGRKLRKALLVPSANKTWGIPGRPTDRTPALARWAAMRKDGQTVRIKDLQTLANEKGKLMSVTYEQRTRRDDWQQRKREIYDNGNSAVVLPYDAERKTVLLTRQLRLPIFLQDGVGSSVEACAGKLDGEKPETRIMKEVEEELGYRIPRVERLFELYVSPAAIMEKITYFIAPYTPADKVSEGVVWPRKAKISR